MVNGETQKEVPLVAKQNKLEHGYHRPVKARKDYVS